MIDSDATGLSDLPGRRPVIGIAASRETMRFSWWTLDCDFMTAAYTDAIQAAGGRVVLLPLDPRDVEHPDEALHGLDALLLPGGNDMDPVNYGHEPHAALGPTSTLLDDVQLALTRAAIAADLPVLGVCRGMQVLNVATGGTLHQHLPDLLDGSEEHRRIPGTLGPENAHQVDVRPGSLAADATQSGDQGQTTSHSHHHQAVDRVGEGFVVTGTAAGDGLVEAIELPSARFCLGVQWHPEADPDSTVIAALVDAARLRITERELSA